MEGCNPPLIDQTNPPSPHFPYKFTGFAKREASGEAEVVQSINRHTYLKGPMNMITSVVIPLALAASSLYMI
ncbi:unnamed protein product, partial [Eruca vesicaria subsp. sativa]|nr:unnamed protein product [Eruca vesicaria subsp. sativa]